MRGKEKKDWSVFLIPFLVSVLKNPWMFPTFCANILPTGGDLLLSRTFPSPSPVIVLSPISMAGQRSTLPYSMRCSYKSMEGEKLPYYLV